MVGGSSMTLLRLLAWSMVAQVHDHAEASDMVDCSFMTMLLLLAWSVVALWPC